MRFAAAAILLAATAFAQAPGTGDTILRAMRDEMERSRMLRMSGLDPWYFLEYSLDDAEAVAVEASMGGLIQSRKSHFRVPQIRVRVGDYQFDNTDYVYSDMFGGRADAEWPLEDNYDAIRQYLWLATDRAYKGAAEAVSRKRAALKSMSEPEAVPDFAKAKPVQLIEDVQRVPIDLTAMETRARAVSGVFSKYPDVLASQVGFDAVQTASYLLNSEGTVARTPDHLVSWKIRAGTMAADGMPLHMATFFYSLAPGRQASETELRRAVTDMADNLVALRKAPVGESYSGPVLFEPQAAAQLFAELLGPNLSLPRRPVAEPGRPLPYIASELEGRSGSRILPEWMDAVDDPTQSEWRGKPLLGFYPIDSEGVIPEPLELIVKGRLKNFLLTRTPAKGYLASNGRARIPSSFGTRAAYFGNLFVKAGETSASSELRRKLVEMLKQRNKAYGYIVRRMDYPSSASVHEIRGLLSAGAQTGGPARPLSSPVLIYRVTVDGKEELVRGLRFRGLTVRSLKDILAASDETQAFDFLYNLAPMAMLGAGGYVAPATVVAPGILFEDLELEPVRMEFDKPPIVPAPPTE